MHELVSILKSRARAGDSKYVLPEASLAGCHAFQDNLKIVLFLMKTTTQLLRVCA